MQKLLVRLGITLAIAFLAIQVFRPSRTNPEEIPGRALQSHVIWQPQIEGVWERACSDCHSNRTDWPWYSNIAPASWFVTQHVNHARDHLNVSEWQGYDPVEQIAHLNKMCDYVRIGKMPLASYTWIHRSALLSPEEKESLCTWTRQAVERMRSEEAEASEENRTKSGSGTAAAEEGESRAQ